MRFSKLTLSVCFLLGAAFSHAQGGFTLSNQEQKPDVKKTKGQPIAKSKEEFDAYQAAAAITDLGAKEKAAMDFAEKFPSSDIRATLWSSLMQDYFFKQGNAKKATEMGRKVLDLDPDNVYAMVVTSNALEFTVRATDIDKDEKLKESAKLAQAGLDGMDEKLVLLPNLTEDQINNVKHQLRSIAHTTLGDIAYKKEDYDTAEKQYTQAIEMDKDNIDGMTYLFLSISEDHLKKYTEAMKFADQSISVSQKDQG